MTEYQDLSTEEIKQVYDKAFTFLHDHADHVNSLFEKTTPCIAPSGSDLFHPELWKGIHWAWFIKKESGK